MVQLDTRLPLGIQQPDFLNALAQGTQNAGNQAALMRQAEGQNLFRQHGAGAMQGNQNALAQIAGFDPMMAQGMDINRQENRRADQRLSLDRQRLDMMRVATARSLAEAQDQAQAAAEATQFDRLATAAIRAHAAGDQSAWERLTTEAFDTPLPFSEDGVAALAASHAGAKTYLSSRPKAETDTAREQKIRENTADLIAEGMDPELAERRARAFVDGRTQVSDGIVFDRGTQDIAGFQPVEAGSARPPRQGLYDRADDATGVAARAAQVSSDTLGQLPGIGGMFDFPDQVQAQQAFRTANNDLIRSLSINPRFPVAEMERIRRELGFDPAVFSSPEATRSRMRELDQYLADRIEREVTFANQQGNPISDRRNAATAVRDMQRFRDILGVPQAAESTALPPEIANNPTLVGVAERNGVTVRELWDNLTPEARQRFGGQ